MISGTEFNYEPSGPFDLRNQNKYFGGWPVLAKDPESIVLSFPVEGWEGSAAVVLKQTPAGLVEGKIYAEISATSTARAKAKRQALAALSLDINAQAWPNVGDRDKVIGSLQQQYNYLRPTLFHSPYEAAASFIIGHRISIKQARAIRQRLAEEFGEKMTVDDQVFSAFPLPQTLLKLESISGLSEQKVERLHAVAQAALDGWLDRDKLRQQPVEAALAQLETLPGVGPFFSQGILFRGAGIADGLTDDDVLRHGIEYAYKLAKAPSSTDVAKIAEAWRPYQMWAVVLVHIWVRNELGMPPRTFSK